MKDKIFNNEFRKYANSRGISSMNLHYYDQVVKNNGITPYILEERKLNVTQMDVFSRLMKDRIIWVSGFLNDYVSSIVQAQLMFLESVDDKRDIIMHIDTPGGSVKSGLSIIDVMYYIKPEIHTVNTGMAASMGSVLLSSGSKGKRSSLNFSKLMIHQVSGGTQGNVEEMRISQRETEKYNYILMKILSDNTGKSLETIIEDSKKDKWFNSQESLEYGFIDEVIESKRGQKISDIMAGFEEYYEKNIR